MFSKTTCPFCDKVKKLFAEKGIEAHYIELDTQDAVEDGANIQAILEEKTGQRTVPNIFINGRHLGMLFA